MLDLAGQTIRAYQVDKHIATGGHGMLYRAHHQTTGQVVALKVLLPEHTQDEQLLQRLQQEVDIIRDLRHPHIVPLIESWQDNGIIYLTMPWLDGGNLRQLLNTHGRLSPQQWHPILSQIASALDAAHAAQIVHRDIKPENILLDHDGIAYLTDFGVAKRMNQSTNITTLGVVMGTPQYLSPEQIMGTMLSNRTDVYALGITLYEMLNGEHPYADTHSQVQLMMRLMQETLPPLHREDLPDEVVSEINQLVLRATDKDPHNRYLTASSLAYHFAQIAATITP